MYGDITGDCGFTLSDLDFIKRHMAGDPPSTPSAAQLSTMDIDYDGDIDASDVTFILLALAKKYRFLAPAGASGVATRPSDMVALSSSSPAGATS